MVDVVSKERFELFVTPVYRGLIQDENFIDDLKNKILELKENEIGEYQYKNKHFETPDDLHERPEFQMLNELVLNESAKIFNDWNLVYDSHYITGMWGTVTEFGYTHQLHNHPNCLLSGLLYLNAPENCSKLVFRDPRTSRIPICYEYTDYNEFNAGSHYFKPKKGNMLFWPHWLDHGVERGTYEGEEYRIMIAFNVMVKTNIKIKTSKLRI